jgi:endonuclease YncB( thermonuclease family)
VSTLAFLLLIAALLLFFFSTRQWRIALRAAVWAGGVLLLVVAFLALGDQQRDPELGVAIADFLAKIGNPGDSLLMRMLDSNGATVTRIILSLFDIFLVLAVIVSILALVAFRPGEEMERIIRPVMIGFIGAILGGLFALTIVGTGFGTRDKRQAYAGPAVSETVFNAETLLLNGDLLRLRGIDSYEVGQPCRLGARVEDCGAESTRALRRIVEGAFLMCALDAQNDPTARVATCTAVRPGGEEFNVARRLVEEGYALSVGGLYQSASDDARARGRGLSAWCSVQPDAWARLTPVQKAAFRDKGAYPPGTPISGVCPPPPKDAGKSGKKPKPRPSTGAVIDAPN